MKSLYIEIVQEYARQFFNLSSVNSWREDMHGVSFEIKLSSIGVETARKNFTQVYQIKGYLYNVRLGNADIHNKNITGSFFDQYKDQYKDQSPICEYCFAPCDFVTCLDCQNKIDAGKM